jgi:tetratricopeptide (TPR) repeat protein
MPAPKLAIAITDERLSEIYEHLAARRVAKGRAALEDFVELIPQLHPEIRNSAQLLALFAIWGDVDPGYLEPVRITVKNKFPPSVRAAMAFRDAVAIRLIDGLIAMHEQRPKDAIPEFILVNRARDVYHPDQITVAAHCMARCYRDCGEYEAAESSVEQALQLSRHPAQSAVISLLKVWLLYHRYDRKDRGRATDEERQIRKQAESVLRKAVLALSSTDDYITLGNLFAMIARRWRRLGQYRDATEVYKQDALPRFEDAFKKLGIRHPNHRRACANAGFCSRLVALRIETNLEPRLMKEKTEGYLLEVQDACDKIASRTPSLAKVVGLLRQEIEARIVVLSRETSKDYTTAREEIRQYRRRAQKWLAEAKEMKIPLQRGLGMSSIYLAYYYLDVGNLTAAAAEAKEALEISGSDNPLLSARAYVVLSVIENRHAERKISEQDSRDHLKTAEQHARRAIESAQAANHPGVIAKSMTWLGITLASQQYHTPKARRDALNACEVAAGILERSNRADYIWEDFLTLKSKLFGLAAGKSEIRDWLIGRSPLTLRDMEVLVANIVWRRHGKDLRATRDELGIGEDALHRILSDPGHLRPKTKRNDEKGLISSLRRSSERVSSKGGNPK